MAPVIHGTFLQFSDQGISARGTLDVPAKEKIMDVHAGAHAAVENILDTIKEML
jgi:hypothetical protein